MHTFFFNTVSYMVVVIKTNIIDKLAYSSLEYYFL